jgi:hypothetical protein
VQASDVSTSNSRKSGKPRIFFISLKSKVLRSTALQQTGIPDFA